MSSEAERDKDKDPEWLKRHLASQPTPTFSYATIPQDMIECCDDIICYGVWNIAKTLYLRWETTRQGPMGWCNRSHIQQGGEDNIRKVLERLLKHQLIFESKAGHGGSYYRLTNAIPVWSNHVDTIYQNTKTPNTKGI